jgi:lipopolysaccharide export LptBFGC system permease protein LptF
VGLTATAVYFALNEFAVPACDRWAEQILNRHTNSQNDPKEKSKLAQHGFRNSRANRSWMFFGDYDACNNAMRSPTVTWTLPDGSWRAVRAEQAVLTNNVWTFFNVQLFKQAGPHGELVPSGFTNVLELPEFDETPEQIRMLLKFTDAQTLHGSSNADIPLGELWKFLRSNPGLRAEDEHALQTKFFGRLATPWECFVVVLVAIPFGAKTGRRNLFMGVAGSIFIGFAYFILQRVSLALGMNGLLPGWLAAWLPNIAFATIGIALTFRVR